MKTKIQMIAMAVSLLAPLPALSATQIAVANTVAGLGTEIDVSGVAATSGTELRVYPPYGAELILPLNNSEVVTLAGSETEIAGVYEVELVTEGDTTARTTFTVLPDTIDALNSSVQSTSQYLQPDGQDRARVSVILRDRFGNTLSSRPVELISSRPSDNISSLTNETDESGKQQFDVTTFEPGTISLRAMDLLSGKLLGQTVTLQAGASMGGYPVQQYYPAQYAQPQALYPSYQNPPAQYGGSRMVGSVMGRTLYGQVNGFDVIDSFILEVPQELHVNEDTTIRITAIDRNGQRVEDYTGIALLSSTDPTALLPLEGRVQFMPQNLGEKVLTLGLRFRTPGEHILHVEDSTNINVNEEVFISVTGDPTIAEPNIIITSHENDDYINSETITLEGSGQPFVNIVVSGGVNDVQGETDQDGTFSVEVPLNPQQTDHTLRVRDTSGRSDSGNLHLIFDNTPPEIKTIIFDPIDPEVGDTVELEVETDGDVMSVTMELEEKKFELIANTTQSGSFTLSFTAEEEGTHQPVIKAFDRAGNEMEVRGNIVVKKKSLPRVENVEAEPKTGSVSLTWDPVTEERVDAYRIYVGENPDDFLYTLDTDRATAAATVAGLNPGKTYYFAVTALQGDRESAEKSEVIEVMALGFTLNITEQDSSLLIEWGNPSEETPLSTYLLEYGVAENTLTEQRIISGELRAYSLRDMINGITYYLRLTPVATTGDVLHDLAAEGSGTPRSPIDGFIPTSANPVPDNLIPDNTYQPSQQPPSNMHKGAPALSEEGLPLPVWIALGVAGVLLLLNWHRRRTLRMTFEFMKQMEAQYRHS
ncbi:fibronectin type III domain-containing protein [Patescibacteria group bacterium]|nr:fibronectin type III domain-containing protein [Patescibacteria group bacterium]MBU2258973.1 fibronectin type III domain-containing protein [Patescibacteria group bacterium]